MGDLKDGSAKEHESSAKRATSAFLASSGGFALDDWRPRLVFLRPENSAVVDSDAGGFVGKVEKSVPQILSDLHKVEFVPCSRRLHLRH